MHNALAGVPSWLTLVLLTAAPAALVVLGHWRFRRAVPSGLLLPHHEVAGFLVAVVGVLYAVVLGFLVIDVWTAFDQAQRNADAEAGSVAESFAAGEEFPQRQRASISALLARYAFEVRDREWPMLERGTADPCARRLLVTANRVMNDPELAPPGTSLAVILHDETLRTQGLASLRDLAHERRQRLIDADSHLPPVLYVALFIGALLVIAFAFLFGVSNQAIQLTMTGLLSASIGLLFALTFLLEHPYSGSYRVVSDAWTLVIENNDFAAYLGRAPLAANSPHDYCEPPPRA